ncbi:MAG: hypothetical protein WBD31_03610 [Rubripirellula sp.]
MTQTQLHASSSYSQSPNPAQEGAAAGASASSHSSAETRLIELAKKTWKWLVVATVISAGAGYYWAKDHNSTTYQVESRLVYNKTFFGAPLYQGLDIRTLLKEFNSKEAIEELVAKRNLLVPTDFMSRQVEANVDGGEGSVTITMDWADQKDGIEMLDDLVEIGLRRTRDIRDQGLDQHLVGLHKAIEKEAKPEIAALKAQYAAISKRNGVEDISVASEQWKTKLEVMESELRTQQAIFQANQEQIARLESGVALVATSIKDNDFVPKQKTVSATALLSRITDLESDIVEQRHQAIVEAKLRSKEAELTRIEPLVQRGLMPQSRYNELSAEVEQLRLEARGDGAVADMEEELDRLNRQMESFGDDPSTAVEAMRESSRIKSVLDMQLATARVHIEHLESAIGYLEPKINEMDKSMILARTLEKEIAIEESKLEVNETFVEQLETLKHGDAHGFRVIEAAAPSMMPEKNDYRKQFATAFMLCLMGLSIPVLGLGLRSVLPTPGTSLAERMNIAEIGTISKSELRAASSTGKKAALIPDSVRIAAVRLQHVSSGLANRLVHVVGLNGRSASIATTKQLAVSMAKLGEEVMVVLVGETMLDENETFREITEDDQPNRLRIVAMGDLPADEILSLLHTDFQTDGLVLLTGLSCKNRADMELVSLKSGAVLLSAPGGAKFTDAANEVVGSLTKFNVPMIGVIS